jgi:cyanate permease
MISIGAPKLIALWFHGPERGMAMGIYISGVNIGGIVALSATNAVLMPLTGGDWRAVMWIWAGLVLAAGALWWAVARHPEARRRDGPGFGAGGMSKGESVAALLAIARLRVVQVVLVMSVGIFFVNHGLGNWLPEILRDKGMTPAAAGLWAAIPTVVGVFGALVIPRLATPERRVAIMGGLILSAIAATLLLQLAPGAALAAGLILQGIARSSMMTVAILLLMEAPGVPSARAGMAGGMFFTVAEIGGVLGPLSVGALSDVSGGFALPLAAMTAICVGLMALLGLLRLLEGVARRARSG